MAQTSPDCTETVLREGAACYQTLDGHIVRVAQVYAQILELNAIGGTDYTTDISALLQDACKWKRMGPGLGVGIREAVRLFILLRNAEGAGASVPANLIELMSAISCLKDMDEDTLNAVAHELECQLGTHEAYT